MNLALTFAEQVRARPGAPAIIDRHRRADRVTTFAELDAQAARAARLLVDRGLNPGDAVLVFYPMSAELYVALLAIFRLRLVAMFLDPSAGREHIERCCELHRPRALIAGPKAHLLRLVSPALRRIPVKFVIGFPVPGAVRWSRAARLEPVAEVGACEPDTPALLTFTSGSTGQPKAAVRTHGFLLAQHRALVDSLHLTPGDVDLATLPIVALANLGSGVTSVIPDADLRYPGAIDPVPVIAQMQTHHVTSSVASPAFFQCLTRYSLVDYPRAILRKSPRTIPGKFSFADYPKGITLPGVKKLFTGGAPVFYPLLDAMRQMAPQAEVVAVYGSTEAEPIAHFSLREMDGEDWHGMMKGNGLLAGRPVECIRLRILRDQWGRPIGPYTEAEFNDLCCPPTNPGEIVVSGEHVLPGYLHGAGDEETKFQVDGVVWHRTGDAGYLDERGRLWLLGRCAARISDSHGVVYPFAVEAAVSASFPEIRRSAFVSHRGRRVLVVELDPDPSRVLSEGSPAQELAWFKIDEVRYLKTIPVDKRHNAKIDYPALYRLLDQD
jgi:acyl-CoA synthetase (AMP-forming)/AMP-acid ligase II